MPLVEAGFGKFLLILSPLAIGGGIVGYAKYDKEFRQTLVKNVPGIEPVLEVFIDDVNPFADIQKKLGEYQKKVTDTTSSITSSVSSATSSVTSLFGGESKVEPAKSKDRLELIHLSLSYHLNIFRVGTSEVVCPPNNQQLEDSTSHGFIISG